MRHNSSLICMVGISYVYIDTIFAFYGYCFFLFYTHLYCLVGRLNMMVWTHAVLGVLLASVLYFCMCTCSAQVSMFDIERRLRNTLTTIVTLPHQQSSLHSVTVHDQRIMA